MPENGNITDGLIGNVIKHTQQSHQCALSHLSAGALRTHAVWFLAVSQGRTGGSSPTDEAPSVSVHGAERLCERWPVGGVCYPKIIELLLLLLWLHSPPGLAADRCDCELCPSVQSECVCAAQQSNHFVKAPVITSDAWKGNVSCGALCKDMLCLEVLEKHSGQQLSAWDDR